MRVNTLEAHNEKARAQSTLTRKEYIGNERSGWERKLSRGDRVGLGP